MSYQRDGANCKAFLDSRGLQKVIRGMDAFDPSLCYLPSHLEWRLAFEPVSVTVGVCSRGQQESRAELPVVRGFLAKRGRHPSAARRHHHEAQRLAVGGRPCVKQHRHDAWLASRGGRGDWRSKHGVPRARGIWIRAIGQQEPDARAMATGDGASECVAPLAWPAKEPIDPLGKVGVDPRRQHRREPLVDLRGRSAQHRRRLRGEKPNRLEPESVLERVNGPLEARYVAFGPHGAASAAG